MNIAEFAKEINALAQKNPKAKVWVDDEQGRKVLANNPFVFDETHESDNGELIHKGDIGISFENT